MYNTEELLYYEHYYSHTNKRTVPAFDFKASTQRNESISQ